jgi:hypothetical protein
MEKMEWDELNKAILSSPEELDKQLKSNESLVVREWLHPDLPRNGLDRLGGNRYFPGFVFLRKYMKRIKMRKIIAVGVETRGKDYHTDWIAEYEGPIDLEIDDQTKARTARYQAYLHDRGGHGHGQE